MDGREIAWLEQLVPASDAFQVLASENDRRGSYSSWDICQKAALDTLLARLRDGVLIAWAPNCRIDSSRDTGTISAETIVSPWDYYRSEAPDRVPMEFWQHFHLAGPNGRSVDWTAGDFLFGYFDGEYSVREGSAYSVHFDPKGLPVVSLPYENHRQKPEQSSLQAKVAEKSDRGRKPAHWWADFAEELAVYALECGMPGGIGMEGQSEVINAVFARLAEAGKAEPARSTVQPVINAVLRRWRQAGK